MLRYRRIWNENNGPLTAQGREPMIGLVVHMLLAEDAAQKAYESALKSEHLPEYLSQIVLEEKEELRGVHDQIKALRDRSK